MSISIVAQVKCNESERCLNSTQFSVIAGLFFVVFFNAAFFQHLVDFAVASGLRGMIFVVNVGLVLWLLTAIVMALVSLPYVAKPILSLMFIGGAIVAYFMNAYGVVIHRLMIQNVLESDYSEVGDLLNIRLACYVVALGVLPSMLLLKINLNFGSFGAEVRRKLTFVIAAFIGCLILILSMSMDYASFFRNHKEIRQMANPLNFIYAGLSYATTGDGVVEVKPIEDDAVVSVFGKAQSKPTLFILVLGETARADHFGINGYARDTTPLIANQHIINFPKVTSCGTETAVSVPCMFSSLGRSGYSDSKGKSQEGLLDVIDHAGISVLWRDNNSSCKGVCNRVAYEEMLHLQVSELCSGAECFDEILLHKLDEKLVAAKGSKVIVLHQKGSHGPDYFKRYPQDKEIFAPVCKTNQLQSCTNQEVVNAFDNTIHYTDYFLNKTIEWLKSKSSDYNTSLIYLSDHGESLGENGLYLHGMPYSIAPKEQKQVPFFMWLSEGYSDANHVDIQCLQRMSENSYSHDNLFHTVLGLLNIQTEVYKAKLDILAECRKITAG